MAENVGGIEYVASIELQQFIKDQRRLSAGLGEIEKDASRFDFSLTKVAAAVNVLAAAMAAVKVAKMADEFRTLQARVDVVAGSVEKGAQAWAEINALSTRTSTAVADNVAMFTRLNASILQLGGTQQDTLRITELVGKAIRVSGASAQEASAAQLQFAQALGSGKLAGDELRSLMDTSPYLMRQLADSLGVPIGKLKELGAEGKLTSDVIVKALGGAAAQINGDFAKLPVTIDNAMTVAKDAASRAALKFDELSGGSRALAGTIKGVGEVLDRLAIQFDVAADKGDEFAKNDAVGAWAKETRTALSYVVDAADVAWQTLSVLGRNVAFVFKGVGSEIGGIGAQIAAVARGDFAGARAIGEEMKRDAEQRRKELDAADAATLARAQTMGERMRQAWASPQASYSNEGRTAGPKEGVIGTPAGSGDGKKKHQFDAEAYLSSLRQANAQGLALIDERESAELAKNRKLLDEKKLNLLEYTQGVAEIEAKASADRQKLIQQESDAAMAAGEAKRQQIEAEGKARAEAAAAAAEEAQKNDAQRLIDQTMGNGQDPVSRLLAENDAKLAAVRFYEEQRLLTEQQASALRVALMTQEQEQLAAIEKAKQQQSQIALMAQLGSYSQAFGGMAEIVGEFAGKQSGVYKAMFAASKAFSIAQSVISITSGIAQALNNPYPANLAFAAQVAGQGAALISTIKGTNFGGGRQYGGPVSAGTMYRVNETGRPELYTASSGEQYMLPNRNGKVTPANKVGGKHGGGGSGWSGDVNIPLTGIAMPDGWFAIRPDQLADAMRRAVRDGHFTGMPR